MKYNRKRHHIKPLVIRSTFERQVKC